MAVCSFVKFSDSDSLIVNTCSSEFTSQYVCMPNSKTEDNKTQKQRFLFYEYLPIAIYACDVNQRKGNRILNF